MHRTLAGGFLFATVALFAAPDQTERVFHLTQDKTPQQMQQIVTTIRAIADIRTASMDATERTVSLTGTAAQLDMAAWLVKELDQARQPSGLQIYRPAGGNDIVRAFFLSHTKTPQQLTEAVTNVRSVADIQRLFVYNSLNALILRAPEIRIKMAEWMLTQLDQPVGRPSPAPNQYKMAEDDVARVFNLTTPQTPQQVQEMVTLIRSITAIQRAFVYNARKAISLRGTSEQIALAEWLVKMLDRQDAASGTNEYKLTAGPENLVRVFYLGDSRSPQDNQHVATQVRSLAHIQRLFVYSPLSALAVRGTVSEVATAEKTIEEAGRAQ